MKIYIFTFLHFSVSFVFEICFKNYLMKGEYKIYFIFDDLYYILSTDNGNDFANISTVDIVFFKLFL